MALTPTQLVTLAEIVREPLADVQDLASDLTDEQETSVSDDLDTWEAIRNSFVRLKGGKDGVDFDNARKRAAIFYRLRNMLGLEFEVYDLDSTEMMELVDLEVGVNFG